MFRFSGVDKRQGCSAWYEYGLVSLAPAPHVDGVGVLSSVIIIAWSGARNIEYLINWLQEVSLEQLLLSKVLFLSLLFLRTDMKELLFCFFKSVLYFLTCAQPAITCKNLTIETLIHERHWCRSGVFIANFEHISHLDLVFLLLTWSR